MNSLDKFIEFEKYIENKKYITSSKTKFNYSFSNGNKVILYLDFSLLFTDKLLYKVEKKLEKGYGLLTVKDLFIYSEPELIVDNLVLLVNELGIKKVDLVCNQLGGYIGQLLFLKYEKYINKMVFIDSNLICDQNSFSEQEELKKYLFSLEQIEELRAMISLEATKQNVLSEIIGLNPKEENFYTKLYSAIFLDYTKIKEKRYLYFLENYLSEFIVSKKRLEDLIRKSYFIKTITLFDIFNTDKTIEKLCGNNWCKLNENIYKQEYNISRITSNINNWLKK